MSPSPELPVSHPAAPTRLLLFDIDGTLVDTGGAGLVSLRESFYQAFPGHEATAFPALDLGGATDRGVARHILGHFGIEDAPELHDHYFLHYTGALERNLLASARAGKGRLLPGVGPLLETLARQPANRLAVLTGNLREGAWIKLRAFGLDTHFTTGAYGDDHHDRNELGPIALGRIFESHAERFLPRHTAVIGDTPRDIACARAFGAKAVAVATGAASRDQLAAAGPDLLLDDFNEIDSVVAGLDALFSEPPSVIPA